jgi:TonB family protein
MEAFAVYLFKSAVWLSGFALIYYLFLRNERFFVLKRFYLISGILISIFLPLISVHYMVELPATELNPVAFTQAQNTILKTVLPNTTDIPLDYKHILMLLYLAGVLFFAFRLIWHVRSLWNTIKESRIIKRGPAKLVRTSEFCSPFSFFNYVFVNPEINNDEVEEIMNHELAHVAQKHWFDLLIIELLRLLQWVNPFVWLYTGFIRLNHEYLADETALQRTSDPAIYKAALLNQMFGSQVIILSNSFNYSINRKRFEMMKKIITSPYRKMKILLILPVIALILYSFAKPEYRLISVSGTPDDLIQISQTIKEVKGTVVQQDGKPLQGAAIIVKGTTQGVSTDSNGCFRLSNVPEDAMLVVSFVGFKSSIVKPGFVSDMTITMVRGIINTEKVNITPSPSPHSSPLSSQDNYMKISSPETPTEQVSPGNSGLKIISTESPSIESSLVVPEFKFRSTETPPPPPPLIVVDGAIRDIDVDKINPGTIESLNVIKGIGAINKYGEKGKNGVIEITTKKADIQEKEGRESDNQILRYENNQQSLNLRGFKTTPMVLIDGVISDINLNQIDPENIESITVLKDKSATSLYGEKAEGGVILVKTKKGNPLSMSKRSDIKVTGDTIVQKKEKAMFVIVEEMPMFPDGQTAMRNWISNSMKYPDEAVKNRITGLVNVKFVVSSSGKVKDVQVSKSVHPLLDAEAIRVIRNMPDWKPGSQNGKPVDVDYLVQVEFKLQ